MRIRPSLRLQPQVEVMGVQEAGVHAVDDSLTNSQRPPVQNPQRSLLVQSQFLMGEQQFLLDSNLYLINKTVSLFLQLHCLKLNS